MQRVRLIVTLKLLHACPSRLTTIMAELPQRPKPKSIVALDIEDPWRPEDVRAQNAKTSLEHNSPGP